MYSISRLKNTPINTSIQPVVGIVLVVVIDAFLFFFELGPADLLFKEMAFAVQTVSVFF
jgi:hypothetical protein